MPGGGPSGVPLDEADLRGALQALPDRLHALASAGWSTDRLPEHDAVSNVVVFAGGDDALDASLVAAVAADSCPVPILVHGGDAVPAFVDGETLAVVLATGGGDDRAAELYEQAGEAGANRVLVAGAGALVDAAADHAVATFAIDPALRAPRGLPGVAAVPLARVLEAIGLFAGADAWVAAAVDALRDRAVRLDVDRNEALQIARRLDRTMPLVYGGGELGHAAARWWKSACNQGAKLPAFANSVPAMCFDELAGFGQAGDVTRQVFTIVLLRHEHEHPLVTEQFALLPDVLDEVVGGIEIVEARGDGALSQGLDLAYLGQWVSLEQAAIAGVDPGPVPIIVEHWSSASR
jgi:glucose/mannose-6-phosphate isomerase